MPPSSACYLDRAAPGPNQHPSAPRVPAKTHAEHVRVHVCVCVSLSMRMQVLSKALEAWGLQVLSLEAEEARAFKAAPTSAEAFICNLQVRPGGGGAEPTAGGHAGMAP